MEAHIIQTLESIVQERSGMTSRIPPDARFKEDLEIDSLLVVDIVIDIERRFGIRLPEEDLVRMSTLGDAARMVKRLSTLPPPPET